MRKLAFPVGILCGAVCYDFIIFFKGYHTEIPFAQTVLMALAGAGIGFAVCFYAVIRALAVVERRGWRRSFVLGPVLGALCGCCCGVVSSILIGPQFARAAAWSGGIIGAALGSVLGLCIGVPLAFLTDRFPEIH